MDNEELKRVMDEIEQEEELIAQLDKRLMELVEIE
jgi:hypothetical protein